MCMRDDRTYHQVMPLRAHKVCSYHPENHTTTRVGVFTPTLAWRGRWMTAEVLPESLWVGTCGLMGRASDVPLHWKPGFHCFEDYKSARKWLDFYLDGRSDYIGNFAKIETVLVRGTIIKGHVDLSEIDYLYEGNPIVKCLRASQIFFSESEWR